jgi:hypothetical protein
VLVPALLHTGPPSRDLVLVRLGGLAQLVGLGLSGLPSRLDVLFELGVRLGLRRRDPLLGLFGSGCKLVQLI